MLGKNAAFQFFSYLFNLEEWAGQDELRGDTGVDRQIVKCPVAWHSDHVQVGKRHIQMFSLKTSPDASRPCLFSNLLTLDCDSVLCTTWRVKSTSAARSEIDAQEKFISFFKVGVLTRVMSGRDTASLESGAGARAANNNVDDLSDVIRSLDKKAQGEFSLRLLLAARSPEQLRGIAPAVHRVFVDARAQVMEETLGTYRRSTRCSLAITSSMSSLCGWQRIAPLMAMQHRSYVPAASVLATSVTKPLVPTFA
jgi:type IV secretion system protein VirB4